MIGEAGSLEAEGVPEVSGAAADLPGCGAPLEDGAGEGTEPRQGDGVPPLHEDAERGWGGRGQVLLAGEGAPQVEDAGHHSDSDGGVNYGSSGRVQVLHDGGAEPQGQQQQGQLHQE
eukprot:8639865-Pyramimonas_sp.AAC.1